jgi:hypothetical protein
MPKLDQKLIKKKLIELTRTKRELESEKNKNIEILKNSLKPKLDTDLLKKSEAAKEYNISEKTIDRMRSKPKGLKYAQKSPKATVWILRKDLEDYLKRDRHDR